MAEKKLRTQWSKEPDDEPDYSDWKVTLAIQKGDDDPATRPLARSSSSSKPKTKKNPPSSSSSSVTYSIHRNILGPQSEYFNRIFKSNDNDGFSEAHHQHSHIDFPSTISVKSFNLIVEAFEALLKYCYLENMDLEGASPVPLLHFCDYFQLEDDFESKVDEYSLKYFEEMTSRNKLHLLYEQIIEFRTAGLNVERAQTMTAESCFNDPYGVLSEGTIADLPLWLDIVSIIQEKGDKNNILLADRKYSSKFCSRCIANFLENNDNLAIDANSFQKLTDEKILPYVEANAALVLLKKEQKYVASEVPIDDDNRNDDEQEESSSLLTNLQHRCVDSLVGKKLERSHNKELRDRAMKVMILLPNCVMGMYLNKTLNSYDELTQKMERDRDKHDAKRRKLVQDNTVRLKNVEQELETEKEKYRLLVERVNRLKGSPFGRNVKSRIQL